MAKKQYFLIVDTETTNGGKVYDFGAVIVDRKGKIYKQLACIVHETAKNSHVDTLFTADDGFFSKQSLQKRTDNYAQMLEEGTRVLASVRAINVWLEKALSTYDPILTAYNSAFDIDKCRKTRINLDMFPRTFCLWSAAFTAYAHSKKFREMVLETHSFNAVTAAGNMTYQTNAEIMTRFVLDNPYLPDEPHTALEDVMYYELPILVKLCTSYTTKFLLEETQKYDWRKVQVKDWFMPR